MSNKERTLLSIILITIAVMVFIDLVEGSVGIAALFGLFLTIKGHLQIKHQLEREQKNFTEYKIEAEAWRDESRKYIDGLAAAIDQQLTKWNLTAAEKEVAFLLLKGLSLKEIASIRNTSEKTARVQSVSIYAKSGLGGRSELSAFFLEDLLAPNNK